MVASSVFRAGAYYQDGILKTDNAKRFTGNRQSYTIILHTMNFRFSSVLKVHIQRTVLQILTRYGAEQLSILQFLYIPVKMLSVDILGCGCKWNTGYRSSCHALERLNQYKSTSDVYRVIGNIDVDWNIRWVKGLRLHATGGYDWSKGRAYICPQRGYIILYNRRTRLQYGPSEGNYNRLLTVYANYNRDFDAINSNIDATFGYDYQY